MGCIEGRSTKSWIDFDFFGNQLSAHLSNKIPELDYCELVDSVKVPIPHFGCIIAMDAFEQIQKSLQNHKVPFIVPPQTRYPNAKGEQKIMFVLDFSGNPIEFKAFKDEAELFST